MVDDTQALLAAARRGLAGRACERLDTQADPHGVLVACSREPYDLVILDFDLGDMDGVSLARMIRRAGHVMPILFWTGRPDAIGLAASELAPATVLAKPSSISELGERLLALWGSCRDTNGSR